MQFVTVFDLAHLGFKGWWFSPFGLIFVALGALFVMAPGLMGRWLPHRLQVRWRRVFDWCFLGFAVIWTAVNFTITFGQYRTLRRALETGNYRTVEGVVTDFHPMPYEGHSMESFVVDGVRFAYSDFVVSAGFNNTSSHGGPIRAGEYVRIAYVGHTIVRLEIRQ